MTNFKSTLFIYKKKIRYFQTKLLCERTSKLCKHFAPILQNGNSSVVLMHFYQKKY